MRDKDVLLQEKIARLEKEVKKANSECKYEGMQTTKKNYDKALKSKPMIIIQPWNA